MTKQRDMLPNSVWLAMWLAMPFVSAAFVLGTVALLRSFA